MTFPEVGRRLVPGESRAGGNNANVQAITADAAHADHRAAAARCQRDRQLPGPVRAIDCQYRGSPGTRPERNGDGRAAVGIPHELCILAVARGYSGRPCGTARPARRWIGHLVGGAGSGRLRHQLRPVLCRAHRPWYWGVAAVSHRRPRRQQLVPRQGTRSSDRHLQRGAQHRHGARAAHPDLADAGLRLAHDVHRHGGRRTCRRRRMVCLLSRCRSIRDRRGPGLYPFGGHRPHIVAGRPEAMGTTVQMPNHVGHDHRQFRWRLPDLGLLRLAAGLSGNPAPHEHRAHRHLCGDPAGVRNSGVIVRRLCIGSAGGATASRR